MDTASQQRSIRFEENVMAALRDGADKVGDARMS